MSERKVIGSDKDRGESSREGWGTTDSPHPSKDTRKRPDLSEPAERDLNPPTHPSRTQGLGQPEETENADEVPVPHGHPSKESGRPDTQ